MKTFLTGLLAGAKKYLLDKILLSLARLAFPAWVIYCLYNLLALAKPFGWGIFDNWDSAWAGQEASTNATVVVIVALVLLVAWYFAEETLDKERTAHRIAYAETLPAAMQRISELETQLAAITTAEAELEKKLEKQVKTTEVAEASSKTHANLAIDRTNEINNLRAKLKKAEEEREHYRQLAGHYQAEADIAQSEAYDASYDADKELLKELDPQITAFVDYHKRVQARVKEYEADHRQGETSEVAATATGLPVAPAAPNGPKNNYLK